MLSKIKTVKKIYNKFNDDNLILVYQMGKVGSTSIENSLNEIGIENIHLHHLFLQKQFKYDKFKEKFWGKTKKILLGRLKLYIISNNSNIKIVSLTREPISRNISAMFQNLYKFIYEYNSINNRMEESLHQMLENIYYKYINHDLPLDWFDLEFKNNFQLNIYDYDFPKEKGWQIIKKNNIELLLLKMEDLNRCESVIGNFLDIDKFKLKRSNSSAQKWYADIYKNFKKKFNPTEEYINRMYNSKYMNHFYTDYEISNFKKYWEKK